MSEDRFGRKPMEPSLHTTQLAGETVWLSSQKYMYWPAAQTLFVADCHFGKVAHFRQAGIGIPQEAGNETFVALHQILRELQPAQVVFLGDLFHSHYNTDFERFRMWRQQFLPVAFRLVVGNHDVEQPRLLQSLGLEVYQALTVGPFFCTHHPTEEQGFNLAGHLHPAIRLTGTAYNSVRLPCFWVQSNGMVLPSFGNFTGSAVIRPAADDQIFALAGSKVVPLGGALVR